MTALQTALTVAGATTLALTVAAPAAIITMPGTDTTNVINWRSTSVTKPLDPDGDNAYGTAGYVLFYTRAATYDGGFVSATGNPLTNSNTLVSAPSFASITNVGMDWAGLSASYVNVDDPSQAISGTVSDIKPGVAGNDGTRSSNFFDIAFSQNLPAGVRFGIIARGTGNDAPTTLRLTQTVGGSALAEYTSATGAAGYSLYFFDISSIQAGDTFRFFASKPAVGNNNVVITGMSFDVVPEPASLALLG